MKRILFVLLLLSVVLSAHAQWDAGTKINKGMEWTPCFSVVSASKSVILINGDPYNRDVLLYHFNTDYSLYLSSGTNVYTTWRTTWSGTESNFPYAYINDNGTVEKSGIVGTPLKGYTYISTDGQYTGPIYGRMEAGASSTTVYAIKLRGRN